MPVIVDSLNPSWDRQELGLGEDIAGAFHVERSMFDVFKSLGISAAKGIGNTLSDASLGVHKGQFSYRSSARDLDVPVLENVLYAKRLAINNHAEMLFNGIAMREFVFAFRMVPQSEQKAAVIDNICEAIRFHAVPEAVANSSGRFLTYPSETDVKWILNGQENTNLPRLSTCAVTNVTVNHAPTGTPAFYRESKVVSGSAPGAVTDLTIRLQEVEIMHKARILQGF